MPPRNGVEMSAVGASGRRRGLGHNLGDSAGSGAILAILQTVVLRRQSAYLLFPIVNGAYRIRRRALSIAGSLDEGLPYLTLLLGVLINEHETCSQRS